MPSISWTKEGVPENKFNVSGHKLHLIDVKRKEVGSYRCTATNAYGTATSLAIVNLNCKYIILYYCYRIDRENKEQVLLLTKQIQEGKETKHTETKQKQQQKKKKAKQGSYCKAIKLGSWDKPSLLASAPTSLL